MQKDQITIIVMVLGVLGLIYLMYGGGDMNPLSNTDYGSASKKEKSNYLLTADNTDYDVLDETTTKDGDGESSDMSSQDSKSAESVGVTPSVATDMSQGATSGVSDESEWLKSKFNNKNKAKPGCYKNSSYDAARRGNQASSDWDTYFDQNNNIIGGSLNDQPGDFQPLDESGGNLATFKTVTGNVCGSNQNCSPDQLFDVDQYLPREVNDDWFDVQPEPVSVKNRHLINITNPIGVNTIGTSSKHSSWDIRGSIACNKAPVSPFLNSSIEADYNLKPLF